MSRSKFGKSAPSLYPGVMTMDMPTEAQRRVLHEIKLRGACTTGELAEVLGVTDVAARRHLSLLAEAGLIERSQRPPQGRGRPASVWTLTQASSEVFPDTHAELTIGLISATRRAIGEEGLQKVIDVRTRDMLGRYQEMMPPASSSLKKRLEALARIRTDEGYMAHVEPESRGVYLLIENHCPICDAASACQGLCRSELLLFRQVLGRGVEIERIEHLLSDGRRCVYRVSSN